MVIQLCSCLRGQVRDFTRYQASPELPLEEAASKKAEAGEALGEALAK